MPSPVSTFSSNGNGKLFLALLLRAATLWREGKEVVYGKNEQWLREATAFCREQTTGSRQLEKTSRQCRGCRELSGALVSYHIVS